MKTIKNTKIGFFPIGIMIYGTLVIFNFLQSLDRQKFNDKARETLEKSKKFAQWADSIHKVSREELRLSRENWDKAGELLEQIKAMRTQKKN